MDSVEKHQSIEAIFPSVSELYHAINSIKLTTEERDVGDLTFATDGLTVHWTNGSKSLQSGVFLGYKVGYCCCCYVCIFIINILHFASAQRSE